MSRASEVRYYTVIKATSIFKRRESVLLVIKSNSDGLSSYKQVAIIPFMEPLSTIFSHEDPFYEHDTRARKFRSARGAENLAKFLH